MNQELQELATHPNRHSALWSAVDSVRECRHSWAGCCSAPAAWQSGILIGHTIHPHHGLQSVLTAGQAGASVPGGPTCQQGSMLGMLCQVHRHQALSHSRAAPSLLAAGGLLTSGIRALHKSALRKSIPAPAFEQPASSARRWFQLTALGFGLVAACIWGYRRATGPDISGPQVYMDFQTGGQNLGRVIVGLYEDSVPDAAANFRGLAGGDAGYGYKGSPVHRAVRGYIIMAGDGSGGMAYNTPRFIPAHNVGSTWHKGLLRPSAVARHDRGTVSLLLEQDGAVRSQFTIGCMAMPRAMDESMLPVGRVVSGIEVVDAISQLPVDASHRPHTPVTITDCGVLPNDNSSSA